jgi:hypothetical protein
MMQAALNALTVWVEVVGVVVAPGVLSHQAEVRAHLSHTARRAARTQHSTASSMHHLSGWQMHWQVQLVCSCLRSFNHEEQQLLARQHLPHALISVVCVCHNNTYRPKHRLQQPRCCSAQAADCSARSCGAIVCQMSCCRSCRAVLDILEQRLGLTFSAAHE